MPHQNKHNQHPNGCSVCHHSEEEEIYPLTTKENAEAQRANATYKHLFKRNAVIDKGLEIKLIENTLCVCKDGQLIIPKPLQRQAVLWITTICNILDTLALKRR